MTVLELMVTLAVMSVAGTLFTAGFINLSEVSRFTTALSDAETLVGRAHERLDNELRSAADMAAAVDLQGNPSLVYVRTSDTDCHSLFLTTAGELRRQQWALGYPPPAANPTEVLARGVAAAEPFHVPDPDPAPPNAAGHPRWYPTKTVTITLTITVGGSPTASASALPESSSRRELVAKFAARNTVQGLQAFTVAYCPLLPPPS